MVMVLFCWRWSLWYCSRCGGCGCEQVARNGSRSTQRLYSSSPPDKLTRCSSRFRCGRLVRLPKLVQHQLCPHFMLALWVACAARTSCSPFGRPALSTRHACPLGGLRAPVRLCETLPAGCPPSPRQPERLSSILSALNHAWATQLGCATALDWSLGGENSQSKFSCGCVC